MTEQIQGPVQSAVTQLMQHMEAAMWSRGIEPQTALEVINVLMFGSPGGNSRGGKVTSVPDWAEDVAGETLASIRRVLDETSGTFSEPSGDEVRLVVLALVRMALQMPDTFDQVLAPGGQG